MRWTSGWRWPWGPAGGRVAHDDGHLARRWRGCDGAVQIAVQVVEVVAGSVPTRGSAVRGLEAHSSAHAFDRVRLIGLVQLYWRINYEIDTIVLFCLVLV
jgi:hypothetical protein